LNLFATSVFSVPLWCLLIIDRFTTEAHGILRLHRKTKNRTPLISRSSLDGQLSRLKFIENLSLLLPLLEGIYSIKIESNGFTAYTVSNVVIERSVAINVNVVLEVGTLGAAILVEPASLIKN